MCIERERERYALTCALGVRAAGGAPERRAASDERPRCALAAWYSVTCYGMLRYATLCCVCTVCMVYGSLIYVCTVR